MTTNKLRNSLFAALLLLSTAANCHAWWNKDWTSRKSFTIDTTDAGVKMAEPVGGPLVLVRLHGGNFDFNTAGQDGVDLRFVTEDDKTVLDHQIEKWDALMNEAFVWVKLPEIASGSQTKFWLYSGNGAEKIEASNDPKATYDDETILVYHFAAGGSANDATKNSNNAESGGPVSEGAIIGSGVRVLGNTVIRIPPTATFKHAEGEPLTWSLWAKVTAEADKAVLFDWVDGSNSFQVGLEKNIPYVAIRDATGLQKTAPGEPITNGAWKHYTVISTNSGTTLYLDGKEYAKLGVPIPALTTLATLGADSTGDNGAVGELDELQISKVARSSAWALFSATNQSGTEAANKLMVVGEAEGGAAGHGGALGHAMEHVSLFGDIAKNMMFDGWLVVFFCAIMAIVGWSVAVKKLFYLNKIQKGSEIFLEQWKKVSADLTALDPSNPESVKSLGGNASPKILKLIKQSPLYHIYHIGAEEIRHRLERKTGFTGLSSRSIQAIKASLDAGITREVHHLNSGLIFLTISIAGGPYVGLLGTVMGVMITFAVIAKSGEVEVNSIAPGIASALLATVAGLIVAIPALFIYSYLSSRIKNIVSNMQLFIDEFIAKMAENYPEPETPLPLRRIELPKETTASK